jgi:hypothetical protein
VSFTDRTLTCRDCGMQFTFTSGEQEFYAQKGFDNEPTSCPSCRAATGLCIAPTASTRSAQAVGADDRPITTDIELQHDPKRTRGSDRGSSSWP